MVIDKKLAYMQATRDILLLNPEGSFNCFLNVVVQMMWRLEWFNPIITRVLRIQEPTGVIASLSQLFTQIIDHAQTSSDAPTLSVDSLRQSLAQATLTQHIFDLKVKADATEALDYILKIIHTELQFNSQDACTCSVHLTCHSRLTEHVLCMECKHEGRGSFDEDFFLQNVSCREILEMGQKIMSQKQGGYDSEFQSPQEEEIDILNGNFFKIFKLLNEKNSKN